MRLSEVLNIAPDGWKIEVENFLGTRRIGWGKHKMIEVGKVLHNFYCRTCADLRTFASGGSLSCLIAGEQLVSIDATLKCPGCETSFEAWYLVASDDDLYSSAPIVYLLRHSVNRRDFAIGAETGAGQFELLMEQAQTAYENQLGAGSMIYLRKILEAVTTEVAAAAGISTIGPRNSRKPYRQLLEEVDEQCHIIPTNFSSNGYRLFSELSDVIHGDSSEEFALLKYPPCKQLVISVINNVKGDQMVASAIEALGWNLDDLAAIAGDQAI